MNSLLIQPGNIFERTGKYLGFIFGFFHNLISLFRKKSFFQSHGIEFAGSIIGSQFSSKAFVKFSTLLWQKKNLPDILSISIRLQGESTYQDILLYSTDQIWKFPLNMFTSNNHDFLSNTFYSITPLSFKGCEVKFRAVPTIHIFSGNRLDRLLESTKKKKVIFDIEIRKESEWKSFGKLYLIEKLNFPDNYLDFSPFNSGMDIMPRGFINFFRYYFFRKIRQ